MDQPAPSLHSVWLEHPVEVLSHLRLKATLEVQETKNTSPREWCFPSKTGNRRKTRNPRKSNFPATQQNQIRELWNRQPRKLDIDDIIISSMMLGTWWFIPLSKWVITLVVNGISGVSPLITRVITHLLSGMNHQAIEIPPATDPDLLIWLVVFGNTLHQNGGGLRVWCGLPLGFAWSIEGNHHIEAAKIIYCSWLSRDIQVYACIYNIL